MPLVYNWLKHTEATRELVEENYGHLGKKEKLSTLVAENVLTQIENLRTYPSVRSHLHSSEVQIHGWIYNIEDGSVLTYDRASHSFVTPFQERFENQGLKDPFSASSNGSAHSTERQGSTRLSPRQRDRIYRGSPAFYNR